MAVITRLLKLKPLSPSSSLLCSFSAPNSETDLRFPVNSLPQLTKSKGRNVQWVFLGCPGIGKGTYASYLSQLLGVPHIATGDLVRHQLSSSSPISNQFAEVVHQGQLVSDEIIIRLLLERLEHGEARGESGFILDGFPRTIRQAVSIF